MKSDMAVRHHRRVAAVRKLALALSAALLTTLTLSALAAYFAAVSAEQEPGF